MVTRARPRIKVCQACGQEFETTGRHRLCKHCRIETDLADRRKWAAIRRRKEVGWA